MVADRCGYVNWVRCLLACLVALVAWPSAAGAVIAPEVVGIARAAWPGSPCEGREQIEEIPYRSMVSLSDGANLVGLAYPERCQVLIVRGLAMNDACTVLVHEFGHLAGYGHPNLGEVGPGDYRDTVMAAPPSLWPACEEHFRRLAPYVLSLRDARAALRRALPPQRRVACLRTDLEEWECVARRDGYAPLRYRVRATGGPRLTITRLP